jgi:hypothetical protein
MKPFPVLILFISYMGNLQAQHLPESLLKPKTSLPAKPKTSKAKEPKVETVVIEKPVYIEKNNDRDGDGLTDAIDLCPDLKGTPKNSGCPEPEKPITPAKEVKIVPERTAALPAKADINWKLKYEYVEKWGDGLFKVSLKNKYGVVNTDGIVTVPIKYDQMGGSFEDGLLLVKNQYERQSSQFTIKYNKCGFVNKMGEEVIPMIYSEAQPFCEGLAMVHKNLKYGYINKNGEMVLPEKFISAESFSEGLALVKLESGGKYGFINSKGALVIPTKYEYAGSFSEGLAFVIHKNKYGYINKSGEIVIPLKYQDAGSFHGGEATVKLKGKEITIDKTGKCIKNCD